jgi:tryptophan synthase beta chain
MNLLGAKVVPVTSGSQTLKDALNEAMRDWVSNVDNTFYMIGTVAGPAPYPSMVRDFQKIIGQECIAQFKALNLEPNYVLACVGGGSNAIGIFHPYLLSKAELIGVEAAGEGLQTPMHAASINKGSVGILHGNKTYVIQNQAGQIIDTHSVSAGMDYPGVGPEHAFLHSIARAHYVAVNDAQAIQAFHNCCRLEGIIPALESSHALAYAFALAPTLPKEQIILVNLSGRGDKDMHTVAEFDAQNRN